MKPLDEQTYRRLEPIFREGWNREFYRRHWKLPRLEDVLELVKQGQMHRIPPIRKQDFRDHWESIMDFTDIIEVVSSSGTTGRPADVPLKAEEERHRVELLARYFAKFGVKAGSRVLHLFSLNDMFSFGPHAWLAMKANRAAAIRCTAQRVDRILQIIEYLKPDFVCGNAFVMVRLAEEAGERWPDPSRLPHRAIFSAASTLGADLRPAPVIKRLQELWGLKEWTNSYGSSETGNIAEECPAHEGLHIDEAFSYVEVVDPITKLPVEDPNTPGEVLVTGLTLPRGFLPIRYATGDITPCLRFDPCSCGNKAPRIGPVVGRADHHLKVTGQTVYPDFLLALAEETPGVARCAVRVRTDKLGGDDVAVLVVPEPSVDAKELMQTVVGRLARNLSVSPAVEMISMERLTAYEQAASAGTNQVKIPRFFDERTKPLR